MSMLDKVLVDANALREAALKSAEAAVLEKAAPKIREAVNALLEQDEGEEGELDDLLGGGAPGLEVDMGPGEVGGMANNLPMGVQDGENLCACPEEDEEIEINFDELEKQMAADEETPTMGQTDLAQGLDLSEPGEDLGVPMGDEEDEFDLDEDIISALLEDTVSEDRVSEKQPSKMPEKKEMSVKKEKKYRDLHKEDVSEEKDHPGKSCNKAHPKMTHAEFTHKGEVDEARMSKDMMSQMSKDAHVDYLRNKAAEKPKKKLAPKHKSMGQEFELEPGTDEPLSLAREGKMIVSKENLREIVRSATGDLFKVQAETKAKNQKLESLLCKVSKQMKDTNLDNAKLLYENQVLKSISLNERQKNKIVEAVSKAGSVEEAKRIYETLIASVGSTQKKKPKSLSEAVERRSTPLFPRRQKPEQASNLLMERMLELAGIK